MRSLSVTYALLTADRGSWLRVTLTSRLGLLLPELEEIASDRLGFPAVPHPGCRALSTPCASPGRPKLGSPPRELGAGPPALLTLLSCWWMSCLSSEAFSGGSDMMPTWAPRGQPQTMQPRSPSSRARSISGGRSTKRRGGAVASDPAGREPGGGGRGGTTNCFQTVRTDRRRGCPPSCLIDAVRPAASSGIPAPPPRVVPDVLGLRSPYRRPEKRRPPRA